MTLGDLTARVLHERLGGFNEIWLNHADGASSLVIQLNGAHALLHFFTHPGHPGFLSQGSRTFVPGHGAYVAFRGATELLPVLMPANAVVTISEALAAGEAYFELDALPLRPGWLEL